MEVIMWLAVLMGKQAHSTRLLISSPSTPPPTKPLPTGTNVASGPRLQRSRSASLPTPDQHGAARSRASSPPPAASPKHGSESSLGRSRHPSVRKFSAGSRLSFRTAAHLLLKQSLVTVFLPSREAIKIIPIQPWWQCCRLAQLPLSLSLALFHLFPWTLLLFTALNSWISMAESPASRTLTSFLSLFILNTSSTFSKCTFVKCIFLGLRVLMCILMLLNLGIGRLES